MRPADCDSPSASRYLIFPASGATGPFGDRTILPACEKMSYEYESPGWFNDAYRCAFVFLMPATPTACAPTPKYAYPPRSSSSCSMVQFTAPSLPPDTLSHSTKTTPLNRDACAGYR